MSVVADEVLPEGWRVEQLGDIAEVISGQSPPGSTYRKKPEGLPFFQGKADFGARHPVATSWCVEPKKIAHPGDILISVRAPVGPTNVADEECCIGRGLAAIRCSEDADRGFVLFALRKFETAISEKGTGSTFDAINRAELLKLDIPLPSLREQKRIAAILTERLAAVEKARKTSVARLEAAHALPAAYLREVFESEEVKGWPAKRLAEVMALRRDIVHPKDSPSGDSVFVGLEHIESGTGRRIGSESVKKEELAGRKPQYFPGDIVYGYLRPYLNKVWIAEFEGLCSVDQYVYSVNPESALNEYVAWYLRSPVYLERAPIGVTPGQLPRIRIDEVEATEIHLPSLETQKRIVLEVEDKLRASLLVQSDIEAELEAISCLAPASLRQAFSGAL